MERSVKGDGSRVLVSAPYGRDAESLAEVLTAHGYDAHVHRDLGALAGDLTETCGAALIVEETLGENAAVLNGALKAQPQWSDVPFIVLTAPRTGRRVAEARLRLPDAMTNAIVIERPLGTVSLISAVASAMHSRRKQFDLRDRIEELAAARDHFSDFNDELERQVAIRTLELERALSELRTEQAERERAETQLRQSQKMEAIGQLTGGIAHDFNNMLTGVIGGLAMMKRRIQAGRTGDLDRFMEAATVSAQRAAGLTQRLLAFSRRQSLDSRPLDVNELVGSLEDLLRRTIGERIALMIVTKPDVPQAVADANQLENAILNLVINARDAMPHGGQLTVETAAVRLDDTYAQSRPGVKPGMYVSVAISDTGVGMAPEIVDKAFDPFFTTKPIGQGTGLGLSMVYGFAKQSEGQVRIHSEPGKGTSVTLFLPSACADAAHDIAAEPEALAQSGHGETVLVVEDDTAVRMLVREVLEELGYVTLEAPKAGTAVPILSSGRPINLMISDVGLPDMNGRQLAEIARTHRPDLPILFVTGYAENAAIRSEFLGTNMAMITKPFTLETLAGKISEMLAGEEAR